MHWIPADISIDFMGMRRKAGVLSFLMVAVSLVSLAIFGLNLGIDFNGGSSVIVAFKSEMAIDRGRLEEVMQTLVAQETGREDTQVTVQDFSTGAGANEAEHRFLIYTEVPSLLTDEQKGQVSDEIRATLGEETRVEVPKEGADTFYITLEGPKPVIATKERLTSLFVELGFKETSITTDIERQYEILRYEELSLILEEKAAQGEEDTGEDAAIVSREAFEKQLAKYVSDKSDARFTVKVEELKAKVDHTLATSFADSFIEVESSTSVSPSVGKDLLNNGLLAILYAIIGILIYITLRFDFRFAPGAVVALVHDVVITLGIFSIFQVKFSLPIIAALLTIVGYSLNDTIVVLDRVRETFDAYRGRDIKDLLNRAINETLSRTVLTSITTGFVVISILLFGGGLIQDFALALMIGIVVGTYSSIYVASPLVYFMDQYLSGRDATRMREARGGGSAVAKGKGKGDKPATA